jgi:septum formation protein
MTREQERPLVLASASPRRRELMDRAGYRFAVVVPEVEELAGPGIGVEELVRRNAELKARAVAERHPEALVVGSDTLVALGDEVFGKPGDLDEARAMLSRLVGRTHSVWSGVCLVHRASDRETVFVEETRVTFRELGPGEIRRYLGMIDPLDKAGAYAAQEHGEFIIERTEGSWTNVVGLPMERLAEALAAFGD